MSKGTRYDYAIVGGGPTGLTLAYYLSREGKRCIVLEREEVLGGCHRVQRVNGGVSAEQSTRAHGVWTEHGPRIYVGAYANFERLLQEMGTSWDELFTPYNYQIADLVRQGTSAFSTRELLALATAFAQLPFNGEHLKKQTVLEFARAQRMSARAIDSLDRSCRMTDGAGADRYTMYEFLQLVNQNSLYKIYQPRFPNDVALVSLWRSALEKQGVEIETSAHVTGISREIDASDFCWQVQTKERAIRAQNCVLAIPPSAAAKLLPRLEAFARASQYIPYLCVSYHWDSRVEIANVWGTPKGAWKVAFIVQSDYTDFAHPDSRTVITAAATDLDAISEFTGKSANQSNADEVKAEILREIESAIGALPPLTLAIISPTVYFQNGWRNTDESFVLTPAGYLGAFEMLPRLYSVGPHNGYSPYEFNSLESAVSNAIVFLNEHASARIPLLEAWTVYQMLARVFLVVLLVSLWLKFR